MGNFRAVTSKSSKRIILPNMPDSSQIDLVRIAGEVETVLLVDWPDQTVPRALLLAGFRVYSFSPDCYAVAELVASYPNDAEGKSFFPPVNKNEIGYLVFRPLDENPVSADIVCVYRPENELPEIVADHVLPLHAKILWLQPPVKSEWARAWASDQAVLFIEEIDIRECAYARIGTRDGC
jgi:CoA binding domain